MARAAAAKKCLRPFQLVCGLLTSRMYASCTSAVGCKVWPGLSVASLRRASSRRWSYTNGKSCDATSGSPAAAASSSASKLVDESDTHEQDKPLVKANNHEKTRSPTRPGRHKQMECRTGQEAVLGSESGQRSAIDRRFATMAGAGLEPATPAFSMRCSTN